MTDDERNLVEFMTQLRRDLHSYPELGFKEKWTKAKVVEQLKLLEIDVYEGVGVVGVLRKGASKTTIALRADMDALPISEETNLPYASKNAGVMHACGHDGHMAMLLGAAKRLSQNVQFDGTVVFVFQPNEENGLGAKAMLNEGALDPYGITEIYALHNLPGAPLGEISTRRGEICASESIFTINIIGQGGHSAMPHTGTDTIVVGAHMIDALQTIVARKLAPNADVVLSVTEFLTDGARNILPGRAQLKGDVRTRNSAERDQVKLLMHQICNGVAVTHNVKVDLSFETEFVETINAAEPTNHAVRVAKRISDQVNADRSPMSFSEDFAQFGQKIPSCFLLLGNGEEGASAMPLHSAKYDFNDDALLTGANFWIGLAMDRLAKENTTRC